MTWIEFIVVIVLIGVLAGLVLPVGGRPRKGTLKLAQARKDMADLAGAIAVFQHDNSSLPVWERTLAQTNHDFTFGTFGTAAAVAITNGTGIEANNSEVIRILTMLPVPEGTPSAQDPAKRNPGRVAYFNARSAPDVRSHGIGPDGVFRDPWGNPYILTFDLDGDGKCQDPLYGIVTLAPHAAPVAIWSSGPDGKASLSERTNVGVNLDNILGLR